MPSVIYAGKHGLRNKVCKTTNAWRNLQPNPNNNMNRRIEIVKIIACFSLLAACASSAASVTISAILDQRVGAAYYRLKWQPQAEDFVTALGRAVTKAG